MIFNTFLLAFSASIDSLGMGISYGLRKTKISSCSILILLCISFFITLFSLLLGNSFSLLLSPFFTKIIGCFLLVGIGSFIIWQTAFQKRKTSSLNSPPLFPKTYQFFIRSLGITIQIIRNPISSDLDSSHSIDAKEAIYLGFALSIDSACIGIGCSLLGFTTIMFPVLTAIFQLCFLSFGQYLGNRIISFSRFPENFWSLVSGSLLIMMGILRLFIS